jgi:hypothetical protein
MPDCRLILDNISDMASLKGSLVTGSDAVDISAAQMTAVADGWQIAIKTVAPAQQNPRLSVSVALYLDVDGRMENNATVGQRLGADMVYGIAYDAGAWKMMREQMNVAENGFETVPTKATYSINNDGYTLNIPYSEVPKTAPAYWKVGVAEKDATRLTVDYAPDSGMACTPSLAPRNNLAELAVRFKNAWNTGLSDQVFVGAVAIAALAVIFYRWKKNKKKKHDLQTQHH